MRHKYLLSLVLFLLWLTLVVCFYMFLSATDRTFERFFFEIYNFIQSIGWWGWLIFVLIYCIRPLFFIIASPFDLLSGLIFWFWGGILVSFFANIASIAFSYFVWYTTAGKYVTIPKKFLRLKKMEGKIRQDTFFHILMLRLIAFPFDLLSYLSWVFKIPFQKFWIASSIGSFPFTLISVLAGSAFHGKWVHSFEELTQNIDYTKLLLSLFLFGVFLLGVQILKAYLKRRKEHLAI